MSSMKKIRRVRVLVYEGDAEIISRTFARNAVQGRHVSPRLTITEMTLELTDTQKELYVKNIKDINALLDLNDSLEV